MRVITIEMPRKLSSRVLFNGKDPCAWGLVLREIGGATNEMLVEGFCAASRLYKIRDDCLVALGVPDDVSKCLGWALETAFANNDEPDPTKRPAILTARLEALAADNPDLEIICIPYEAPVVEEGRELVGV